MGERPSSVQSTPASRRGRGRHQLLGLLVGHGHHDAVERLVAAVDREAPLVDGLDGGAGHDLDAGRRQRGGRPVAVEHAERHPAPADVRGPGVREQADLEHHRRQGERGVARRQVHRGHRDEVPQVGHGVGRLAVVRQPVAEAAVVEAGALPVEAPQREDGRADAQAGRAASGAASAGSPGPGAAAPGAATG